MRFLYYKFSVVEPWETTQTENPCIIKAYLCFVCVPDFVRAFCNVDNLMTMFWHVHVGNSTLEFCVSSIAMKTLSFFSENILLPFNNQIVRSSSKIGKQECPRGILDVFAVDALWVRKASQPNMGQCNVLSAYILGKSADTMQSVVPCMYIYMYLARPRISLPMLATRTLGHSKGKRGHGVTWFYL